VTGRHRLLAVLAPDVVEAIEQLVEELVLEQLGTGSPWLDREAAAGYLSLPISRLEKDKSIPVHRVGKRVLYNRHELDAYLRDGLRPDAARHVLPNQPRPVGSRLRGATEPKEAP
jgi:hypothetical protein